MSASKLAGIISGVANVLSGLDLIVKATGELGDFMPQTGPRKPRPRIIEAESRPAGRELKARSYDVTNIDDRVAHIRKMAKQARSTKNAPKVIKLARSIVNKKCGGDWCIAERDHLGEIKAIFFALRERARYVSDPKDVDVFTSPDAMLEMQGGDCDEYAIALTSMLWAIGYTTKLRIIQTKKSETWDHIFVLVGLPQRKPTKWIALDASLAKPPGWQAPASMVTKYRDFSI